MKVLENLENYEVSANHHLSLEQEEELAKVISEIIPELDKRKSSKLQTRKYFKQHLRYTSNVLDFLGETDTPPDDFMFGQSYAPLAGEYAWDSDILQPALLSILNIERLKYGYIINLIEEDMVMRGSDNGSGIWKVSDGLVRFSQDFDIDEIRDEASKEVDIRKRIMFLRSKLADMQVCDYLIWTEKRDYGIGYEDKLKELIELEEKRLELYPNGFEKSYAPQTTTVAKNERADLFSRVYKYCDEDNNGRQGSYDLLLEAVNLEKSVVDRNIIDKMFTFVDGEFNRFLETCDLLLHDRISDIFEFVDHWFEHFRDSVDDAYSNCQQSIKVSVRKKHTTEDRDTLEKMALMYAHFIVEKATVVVSGLKANILYNHRYVEEVYYNIKGVTLEAFMAERERLENKFGGGDERDVMFDQVSCIEAFYEQILDKAKFGLLEVAGESESMDDEERLSLYRELLKGEIEFGLSFYIDLIKTHPDISMEIYHEAVTWVETTRYIMSSVFLEVELWAASDEDRCIMYDTAYFQQVNFDYIPQILFKALIEYKSDTGNFEIDDQLNDLGERDADEWDYSVPVFDKSVLTEDFITEDEYDDAIRVIEAKEREIARSKGITEFVPAYPIESESQAKTKDTKIIVSPRDKLKSYVIGSNNGDYILEYFDAHISSVSGDKAFIHIEAAIKAGAISRPSYKDVLAVYPNIGNKSNYDKQVGKNKPNWYVPIQPIIEEIKKNLS